MTNKTNDNTDHPKKGPGNHSEAPKKYKDPAGSDETISEPGHSGYEEKQPQQDQ